MDNKLWYVVRVCQVTLVVSDSAMLWMAAGQAPLSVGFSRQERWGGLPRPPPGDLPDPGIELTLSQQVGSLPRAPPGKSCDMRYTHTTEHYLGQRSGRGLITDTCSNTNESKNFMLSEGSKTCYMHR